MLNDAVQGKRDEHLLCKLQLMLKEGPVLTPKGLVRVVRKQLVRQQERCMGRVSLRRARTILYVHLGTCTIPLGTYTCATPSPPSHLLDI